MVAAPSYIERHGTPSVPADLERHPPPTDITQNVDFEGRTKRFVSLFQIGREHIFDPFHECADSARQVAPMRYDQGDDERLVLKIG